MQNKFSGAGSEEACTFLIQTNAEIDVGPNCCIMALPIIFPVPWLHFRVNVYVCAARPLQLPHLKKVQAPYSNPSARILNHNINSSFREPAHNAKRGATILLIHLSLHGSPFHVVISHVGENLFRNKLITKTLIVER